MAKPGPQAGLGEVWYNAGCRHPCNAAQARTEFINTCSQGRIETPKSSSSYAACLSQGCPARLYQGRLGIRAAKPTGEGKDLQSLSVQSEPWHCSPLGNTAEDLKTWANSIYKLSNTWKLSKVLASLWSLPYQENAMSQIIFWDASVGRC